MTAFRERCIFLAEGIRSFRHMGSFTPSSRHLARRLTDPLRQMRNNGSRLEVLEAGAGTGAVTRLLLRLLRAGDRLVAYELNPRLATYLNKHLQPLAKQRGIEFEVRAEPVQNVARSGETHDLVISGLPFNNFPPELVEEILCALLNTTRPDGYFSFYEYVGMRNFKKIFVNTTRREQIRQLEQVFKDHQRRHIHSQKTVWLNFPPARAHFFKKNGLDAHGSYQSGIAVGHESGNGRV